MLGVQELVALDKKIQDAIRKNNEITLSLDDINIKIKEFSALLTSLTQTQEDKEIQLKDARDKYMFHKRIYEATEIDNHEINDELRLLEQGQIELDSKISKQTTMTENTTSNRDNYLGAT